MNKNLILVSLFIIFSFNDATFSMESKKVNSGWYDEQLIARHTYVYLKDDSEYKLHVKSSDAIEPSLYNQSPTLNDSQSHQLLKTTTDSSGTSTATSTLTPTLHKNKKNRTRIQYDTDNIQQNGKDFMVDATCVNAKNQPTGKVNYDGGHFVDYECSEQNPHTDNFNYVPRHHHYNRWLKKYIVKKASDYLEIPIFTPNPPLIKMMNDNSYVSIPIGILLAPLKNLQVQAMYYFPNNQYNYRTCQHNLKSKNDTTKKMIALFKLDKVFHDLLWPAIIHNIREKNNALASRIIQENKRTDNVGKLVKSMSINELDDEEAVLATLTSNVIHQSDVVLSNILSVSKEMLKSMKRDQSNQKALQQSFNVLGHFLIDDALKNALKSEILSTQSRIIFANIVTDFIECQDQVSKKALKRVDQFYGNLYPATLKKLSKSEEDMNLGDLIYYANLYQRLSTPSMGASLLELAGFQICKNLDIATNMIMFIDILSTVYTKTEKKKLNAKQMQNLIDLFLDAQESIAYHICNGCPIEELEDQMAFLKKAKKRVLKWERLTNDTNGTYQTSPNSTSSFRTMPGYKAKQIKYLGTTSSAFYDNDDEDIEQ